MFFGERKKYVYIIGTRTLSDTSFSPFMNRQK